MQRTYWNNTLRAGYTWFGLVVTEYARAHAVIMSVYNSRAIWARSLWWFIAMCFRSLELRAFTFIYGRKIVHHDSIRHRVHLHDGTLSDDAQASSARDLQYDWSYWINLITTNASFGESTDSCCSKHIFRYIRTHVYFELYFDNAREYPWNYTSISIPL